MVRFQNFKMTQMQTERSCGGHVNGGGSCGRHTWSLWWCCHSSLGPSEALRGYLRPFWPAGGTAYPLRPAIATQPPSTLAEHQHKKGSWHLKRPQFTRKPKVTWECKSKHLPKPGCVEMFTDYLLEDLKWTWSESSLSTKEKFLEWNLEYFYQEWRIVLS